MPRTKPTLKPLADLDANEYADCFALLVERTKLTTREGKPYYACRFRDARRNVAVMVWIDGGHFEDCEQSWQVGQCYKVRGTYREHERYGPQLDIEKARPVNDTDQAEGFDPLEFVERSRFDPDAMLTELRGAAES